MLWSLSPACRRLLEPRSLHKDIYILNHNKKNRLEAGLARADEPGRVLHVQQGVAGIHEAEPVSCSGLRDGVGL